MSGMQRNTHNGILPTWAQIAGLVATGLLGLASPAEATTINVDVTVTGVVAGVTVNNIAAAPNGNGYRAMGIPLALGPNTITATATDAAGNSASTSITVHLGTKVNVQGTVDSSTTTVTVNDVAATITAGTFSAFVPMKLGMNTVTANAQDAAGNTNSATTHVFLVRPPVEHP